jgi:hypothetical protein
MIKRKVPEWNYNDIFHDLLTVNARGKSQKDYWKAAIWGKAPKNGKSPGYGSKRIGAQGDHEWFLCCNSSTF